MDVKVGWLCVPLLAACLCGCGGNGSNQSVVNAMGGNTSAPASNTVAKSTGRLAFRIQWPAQSKKASRYLPIYAQSLYIEVYPKGNAAQRYTAVANRPTDGETSQTITIESLLPVGTYAIACAARADVGGQGATVAIATTKSQLNAGQTATVDLTLNSTLKSLTLLNQPFIVKMGTTLQLQANAVDPDGAIVLLPASALQFSVVSGQAAGVVSDAGLFTGQQNGAARIRVTEPNANIAAEADAYVADQNFFQVLNQPLTLKAGQSLALQVAIVDLTGKPTNQPFGKVTWKLVSGSDFANLTPDGTLTANGEGTARVQATEDKLGLTAQADITIVAYGTGVNVGIQ